MTTLILPYDVAHKNRSGDDGRDLSGTSIHFSHPSSLQRVVDRAVNEAYQASFGGVAQGFSKPRGGATDRTVFVPGTLDPRAAQGFMDSFVRYAREEGVNFAMPVRTNPAVGAGS